MSQRLSESAVNDLEARGLGRFTTPLGYRANGTPFYLIGGASPDDPSNDGGNDAGGNGDTGGSGGGSEGQGGTGDGGAGNGADGNKSDGAGTVSKDEYDKLMERMKAADRNSAAAQAKLKELEEKDLSEQEKVLKRVPELEQQNKELAAENQGLKAKVAFLGLDGFSWHDPDVALGQVDLSEAVKDDGSIDKSALKKAAEKLAKEKVFLVKSTADDKGGSGDGKGGSGAGGNNGNGQGSSGSNVGGGGKGGSGNGLDEAALRSKYPALN